VKYVEKDENVKLVLEEWDRSCGAFVDKRTIKVVYGEADRIVLKVHEAHFPYTWYRVIALTPKTTPVIVLVETVDDTTSPIINEITVYVFTKRGWKRVKVC
jgi:hypothetical protein